MTSAITTATQGLLRASSRFEESAARVVASGSNQSNQVQQTIGSSEQGSLPTSRPQSNGVEPVNQPLSTDLTSALIGLSEAEFSFEANARVVSKAYEMSNALLDATRPTG